MHSSNQTSEVGSTSVSSFSCKLLVCFLFAPVSKDLEEIKRVVDAI